MLPEREHETEPPRARERPRPPRRGRVVRIERGRRRQAPPAPLTWRQAIGQLGPGLISGASDLDPTSVATLAIIGATVGYRLLWLVLLLLPMMVAVQVISARVGLAAERRLERAIRDRFGGGWALASMILVVSVNLLTVAADLEGGAAALELLTGLPWQWFVLPLALVTAGLLLLGGYYGMQRVLRYVIVVFGTYLAAGFLVQPDWGAVLYHTLVPELSTEPQYLAGAVALLGTTLTSYVYLWETIEVHEERRPGEQLWLVELDAAIGIAAAVILFAFIIITTAATLWVANQPVQTADDAARALAPAAGPLAGFLFALGLLAGALLALPVLASTTAYVLADLFRWNVGLESAGREARPFHLVLLSTLAIGAAIAYAGIEPFQLLFLASLAGGIGTPVLLALLILVAQDSEIMQGQQIDRPLSAIGWLTTAIVGAAGIAFLVQQATRAFGTYM